MRVTSETAEMTLRNVEKCMKYIVDNNINSVEAAMKKFKIGSSGTFYKYANIIKETNPKLYTEFFNRNPMVKGKYRKYTVIQAKKFCQYILDNNTTMSDAARTLNISHTNARKFLSIIKDINIDLYNVVVADHMDKRKDESYLTRQKLDVAEYILMDPEYKTVTNAIIKFNVSEQTIYNYIDSLKDIDVELYDKVREKVHASGYDALCEANRRKCRKEK